MKNPIEDIVPLNFNQNKILHLGKVPKVSQKVLLKEPSFSREEWNSALEKAGP